MIRATSGDSVPLTIKVLTVVAVATPSFSDTESIVFAPGVATFSRSSCCASLFAGASASAFSMLAAYSPSVLKAMVSSPESANT